MRDNTNPLYLIEGSIFGVPVATGVFATGDEGGGAGGFTRGAIAKGIHGGIGVTSKILKDNRLVSKILQQYPNPESLKQYLLTKLGNSSQARILASKLTPDMSIGDYKSYIRRYICRGTLGRYLLHFAGGSYSGIANAADAGMNEATPVNDLINNSLT